MSDISKSTDNNLGGISKLHYAFQKGITDLFDFEYFRDNLTISQANLDSRFSELSFLLRSGSYDASSKNDKQGVFFKNEVDVVFSKIRTDVETHIANTQNQKLCLIFKTNNGDWFILPYAVQIFKSGTGKQPTNHNGYSFNWSSVLPYSALPIAII